jgi:hypothetical protein
MIDIHFDAKGLGRFQYTVYKEQTDSVFKTESVFRDEYKLFIVQKFRKSDHNSARLTLTFGRSSQCAVDGMGIRHLCRIAG